MLTDDQITSVWERQLASEVRALYFGELASKYTVQKQWISGLSFFLASSAAATIVAKSPAWLPILLACLTALLSAYSVARGLDGATRTMSKFQFAWGELAAGYEAIWNSTWQDDASARLALLSGRENDLSSQASTEAPNNQSRLDYWQQQVFRQHYLVST
jgi:hypothetical protein